MNPKLLLQKIILQGAKALKILPPQKVLSGLKKRGVKLEELNGIELFAGDGSHTSGLMSQAFNSFEMWEKNSKLEHKLRANFPNSKVSIVDSYSQIKITQSKFNYIGVDNWTGMEFSEYCEHFELFDLLFNITEPKSYLVLNIMPEFNFKNLKNLNYSFLDDHLQRRKDFYQYDDSTNIPIDHMISIYEGIAKSFGYSIKWWFAEERSLSNKLRKTPYFKRWSFYYLVLAVENE